MTSPQLRPMVTPERGAVVLRFPQDSCKGVLCPHREVPGASPVLQRLYDVPELDASSAAGPLALVAGALLVVGDRRRRAPVS